MNDLDLLFSAPAGALVIFLLRLVDVSMSVMRMIFSVRGRRILASIVGFFEVFVWLFAAGYAFQHLDSLLHIIGFAGGFSAGTFLGVWLEERFALGYNIVSAVIPLGDNGKRGAETAELLREAGHMVTEILGYERDSVVNILNLVVPRKDVPQVTRTLRACGGDIFISVEDVRNTQGGTIRPGGRKFAFLF